MLKLGIDDAGRGPVIGPMVLAGVLIDERDEEELKKLDVKDSKKLTPRRREVLFVEIIKKARAYKIIVTHPAEIDGRFGFGINLNDIEAIKSAEIINEIVSLNKTNEKVEVIVDCPSPNIQAWKGYLKSKIKDISNLMFKVEHKADVNHIACSAASILAKVTRDKEIEAIKKKLGVDFGSGYSSDPTTQKFLKEYFHKHKKDGIFRETWGTVKNHKARKEQKKLGEF
jgi:ribonuclease HII